MDHRLFCEDIHQSSIANSGGDTTGHIKIWEIDIKDQMNHKFRLEKLLTQEEKQHAARFRQEKDANLYIVTRANLKLLLADVYCMPPEKMIIAAGVNGKPRLNDYAGIHFNVSHTHERAVIALSKHRIGIDLEHMNPAFDFASVAEFACSAAELKLLSETVSPRTEFFKLWTRKEAFLKGLGTGLVNDLKTITCADAVNPISGELQGVLSDWKIMTTMLSGNYIMSVAHDYFLSPVPVTLISLNQSLPF